MKKLFFALTVLASGVCFAASPLELVQKQALEKALALDSSTNNTAAGCADFSGTWSGSCSLGSDVILKDDIVKITQEGCTTIQRGTDSVGIGGLKTYGETRSSDKGSFSYSVAVTTDWNDDRTALLTSFNGIVKTIGHSGSFRFSGSGQTRLSQAGKLVDEMDLLGMKLNCVYEKK